MDISSGIILYRYNNGVYEFFVCTPGGPYWKSNELWNFPKGHVEEGETAFEAAIREFSEETSVNLINEESKYSYLGLVKQNTNKSVHVFSKKYEGENLSNCKSIMMTTKYKGKLYKHHEIKKYKWISFEDICNVGIKSYIPIYKLIIFNETNGKNHQ